MDASIPGRVFSIQRPSRSQEVGTIAALLKDSMNGGRREGQALFQPQGRRAAYFAGIWQEPSTRATSALRSRSGSRCGLTPNELRVAENLLLDLKEFTVRPMDRAMNNVQAEGLGRDRPIRGQPRPMPGTAGWEDTVHWLDCAWFARWKSFHTTTVFRAGLSELGYVEDNNIILVARSAEGMPERLPRFVDELLRENVSGIVSPGPAIRVVREKINPSRSSSLLAATLLRRLC